MEQSGGKIGIPPMDFFGPYRLPKKLFQYGLNEFNQQGGCPPGYVCDGRLAQDCDVLWREAEGQDIKSQYDIVLRIYAGYDETSVWQEFGEMMYSTKKAHPSTLKVCLILLICSIYIIILNQITTRPVIRPHIPRSFCRACILANLGEGPAAAVLATLGATNSKAITVISSITKTAMCLMAK